ncbi:MAG: HupE/UreJ family protein [Alphaproteobacteria bacterium]
MMKRLLLLLGLVLASLLPTIVPTQAHEGRPLLIRITNDDGMISLTWQAPPVLPAGAEPRVIIADCLPIDVPQNGLLGQGRFDCADHTVTPVLSILWPSINPALSTLVEVKGRTTRFYGPEDRQIPLSDLMSSETDFGSFIETGVEHILSGFDHLLFILGLTLLILRGPGAQKARRLALMVTGFTLAHSLTLGLAVFDLIALPAPPVEAVIALSVMFVGLELARNNQATLTWRYPALTASAFGLLHGLGFASILSDAGLADEQRLLGLIGFNIGVELGQLFFVTLIIMGAVVIARLTNDKTQARLQYLTALFIGVIAASWMFERVLGFWG